MIILILSSCFAFLKKFNATLLVFSFLSIVTISPSFGKAKDIDKVLKPVNVPISSIFLIFDILTIRNSN